MIVLPIIAAVVVLLVYCISRAKPMPTPLEDFEQLSKANRDRRYFMAHANTFSVERVRTVHANEISAERFKLDKERRRRVREKTDKAAQVRRAQWNR